jgi:DNA repair protein RadC
MHNSDSLFPLEPVVRQRGAYMVRNLRLVADVVCEAPAECLDAPEDMVRYMADAWYGFPEREQCWLVFLNGRNRPIGRHLLTVGTDRQCLVAPRDVLRSVLLAGAQGFVVLHNHPSGDPQPSAADVAVTRSIRAAAEVVDVRLHDHVVVGEPRHDPLGLGYYSFRRGGLL